MGGDFGDPPGRGLGTGRRCAILDVLLGRLAMDEFFDALLIAAGVAVVVVPLLVWLVGRQIFRHRPMLTMSLLLLGVVTLPLGLLAWLMALRIQMQGRQLAAAGPRAVGSRPAGYRAVGQWGRWA